MSESEVNATDGAKKLAAELGVDLNEVEGSGEKGRVEKPDVQNYYDEEVGSGEGAGAETEGGETSPNVDNDTLNDEAELGGNDPAEFDAEKSEKVSIRLVPHLDDTGLVILEADNSDDEIQEAIDRERGKRDSRIDEVDGEDVIEFVKLMANIKRRPMSRSQVARRAQRVLTDRGIDWRRGK